MESKQQMTYTYIFSTYNCEDDSSLQICVMLCTDVIQVVCLPGLSFVLTIRI